MPQFIYFFSNIMSKNKIISHFTGKNAKLSDEFKSSDDTDYDKFLFYSILNFFHTQNRRTFFYSESYLRKSFSNSLRFLLLKFQKQWGNEKNTPRIFHSFWKRDIYISCRKWGFSEAINNTWRGERISHSSSCSYIWEENFIFGILDFKMQPRYPLVDGTQNGEFNTNKFMSEF